MLETDKSPQLDERIWQAWIKKNEAKDKASFSRRAQWIAAVAALLALTALLTRFI